MKKSSWKLVLCLALAAVMLMCTALAAIEQGDVAAADGATITVGSDGKLTVAVSGLTANKQYVLLQVKVDSDAETAAALLANPPAYEVGTEDTILYIDQDAAATGGSVSFSNFLPKSVSTSLFVLGGDDQPKIVGALKANGVSVKGKVSSYNTKNATTVTLSNATGDSYTATIPAESTSDAGAKAQDFEVTGVPAGTYDLKVTKAGHLSYTVTGVVVGDTEVDLSASSKAYSLMTLLCADIDGNDRSNASDLATFRTDFGKTTGNPLTDCDGNGRRNAQDLAAFRLGFGKAAPKIAY